MKVFVDVGRNKPHTVFVPEMGQILSTNSLSELLKGTLTPEEVYVDSLFPNVLSDLLELVTDSGRIDIYYLRRISLISTLREKKRIAKNDENDAKLLARIPAQEFKKLSETEIRLRMLTNDYYVVADTLKLLRQKEKATSHKALNDARKFLERQHYKIEKEILAESEKFLPHYRLLRDALGVSGVSLAVLVTQIDLAQGFDKLLRQAGRTAKQRKTKRFSRKAMRALAGLAVHSLRHERYGQVYHYYQGILKSKRKALLRIATRSNMDTQGRSPHHYRKTATRGSNPE